MCAYKDSSDLEQLKKREYLKQQHQLRTMTKTTNVLSADDMIENLLSKKEIFKMKKDATNPSKNKAGQVMIPHWLISGHEPAIYKRVWDLVGTPIGYADTPKLTNILLTSHLTTDVLGYIWSLSNSNLGPALLQHDTYTALALVALAQNGFGFTSSAVLNTMKEAPIPKLELNIDEVPLVMSGMTMTKPEVPSAMPGMTMTKPEVPTPSTKCSLSPIVSTVCPPLSLPPASSISNPVMSSVTSEFASKSTTPIAISPILPIASNSAASLLADNLNLLDLEMPSVSLAKTPTSLGSTSASILDEEHIFPPTKKITADNKTKISSEQSKESADNIINPKTLVTISYDSAKNKNMDFKETQMLTLADDLFGDFQSVPIPQIKEEIIEDVEFDEFKSADFSPLTLLEVKEKPPELKLVQPPRFEPSFQEKTAAIEDLFPKCVVKPKDDGDLLVEEEDKYSALRGLTTGGDYDEFGDFLTAAPTQPSVLLPPLVEFQANIQERAMKACIGILEEAKKIFHSIEESEVLKEVVTDPRGIQYLEELIEVERIAQRLQVALNKEEFTVKLEELSIELLQYLEPHKNSYMEEESGPKCGICLSERGPAYVKYGINNFHAPCANLYLHKVDSVLPIAPIM